MANETKTTVSIGKNLSLSASELIALALALSPEMTLVIQGETGIGKTSVVSQIAATLRDDFYKDAANCERMTRAWDQIHGGTNPLGEWSFERGLPVMARRLSQMTDGDLLGIPLQGEGEAPGTKFNATDWYRFSCQFPVALFLDERNRAQQSVKQAVFELLDEHRLCGFKMHPSSRLFIAENVGDQYQVESLDPAEVSKAALVTFAPTVQDWISWARNNKVAEEIVAFIEDMERGAHGSGTLEPPQGFTREPGKRYPDRRAWARCAAQLEKAGLLKNPDSPLFTTIVGSVVAPEVAIQLRDFVANNFKDISADEILADWKKASKKLPKGDIPQSTWIGLTEKVANVVSSRPLTEKEAKNVLDFATMSPPECIMKIWCSIKMASGPKEGEPNLELVKIIAPLMMETVKAEIKD